MLKLFSRFSDKPTMKILVLSIALSGFAWGAESSSLYLRGRVPLIYRLEVTALGRLLPHTNMLRKTQLPRVVSVVAGGYRLVTVTQP